MFNFNKNNKYASIALYAGATVIVCALIIMCMFRFETVLSYINGFLSVLSPFVYGFIFAYLCNPVLNFFEKRVFTFKKAKKDPRVLRRTLSLISTIVTIFAVLSVLVYTVLPQAIKSVEDLGGQLNNYISSMQNFADSLVSKHSGSILGKQFDTLSSLMSEYDISFSIKDILSNSYTFLQGILNYIINYGTVIVGEVINVLMGLIVAIYFLIYKERICAQTKKLLNAILSRRAYLNTVRLARYTHRTFGGFIVGKIIDSIIIGLMSFLIFWIFKIPYYPLLAVLIGITNIIPTFGPIIGGVIGTLMLLIVSPEEAVLFIIIVLIIQQIDGNIIGPKILGNSIGISALWVVIAILLCGGLFGFVGMIVGVPATAVIYVLVKQWTERRLKHKGYPVHTAYYASDPAAETDTIDAGQVFIDRSTPVPELSAKDDIDDPIPEKKKTSIIKRFNNYIKRKKQQKGSGKQ